MHVSQLIYHTFFFFNDTATTEIYTLSLHDALPICRSSCQTDIRTFVWNLPEACSPSWETVVSSISAEASNSTRSEEHTSELQSRQYLVCRLLLEKKKNKNTTLYLTSTT